MKMIRFFLFAFAITIISSSCNLFKPKYGCGTDGKNVGAEKILNEQPKKTPKFKA
jgi:hypothetical protein